ncbi:hypothetical protein Airi02_021140 [Actinoallomurus iriomotensis]|uniref:Uncharacterized protein n=1 Tax=Actinoallomurus iriomotensis TaxID=478107 RepID=A0A9W6VXS7_9ACTN|nr:hypothetical protein Airi02_021140 [Actinoallomurus iriomotensis]
MATVAARGGDEPDAVDLTDEGGEHPRERLCRHRARAGHVGGEVLRPVAQLGVRRQGGRGRLEEQRVCGPGGQGAGPAAVLQPRDARQVLLRHAEERLAVDAERGGDPLPQDLGDGAAGRAPYGLTDDVAEGQRVVGGHGAGRPERPQIGDAGARGVPAAQVAESQAGRCERHSGRVSTWASVMPLLPWAPNSGQYSAMGTS